MVDDERVRLEAFLRGRCGDPETFKITEYQRILGGYSRSMARVWVEDATGRYGYIVRSDPPPGSAFIDTDRADEWLLLRALHDTGTVPMAAPLWCDVTGEHLGSPTIISELIEGPSLLAAAVPLDEPARLAMGLRFAETATAVHTSDVNALPPHLARPASWNEYIDGRIEAWIETERAHEGSDPFMRLVAAWLAANKPAPIPLGLVHGDFQPNNAVLHPDDRYVMIDWELAHIGDAREDLGWMNLCGANQPPDLIASDREAFYERYRELRGLSADEVNAATIAYFTVLGASSVFLPMVRQLDAFIRGEASGIPLTYITLGLSGMHNVILDCMASHARATGGVW